LMDGAVNPYLGQATILAAGLDGIKNKRKPGQRLDIDMYAEPHKARGTKKLPLNLLDAIRLTDKSRGVRACRGNELIDSYVKLKTQEWESYCRDLSDWER
jgi:glutamine synthetase